MRTETIEIYTFNELSEDAKKKAIENERSSRYRNNDFAEWAIDDCFLLNPPYKEIEKINKELPENLLIKNTREIYFSLDRDRYIDISKAMNVQCEETLLKWLKITDRMIEEDNIYFTIGKDTIHFEENDPETNFSDRDLRILERAKKIFEDHCEQILKDIEASIDYRFTDECILEDLDNYDYDYTKDGKEYYY